MLSDSVLLPVSRAAVSLPGLWRGNEWGTPLAAVQSSGHPALDAELPGGGWPCHAITEILQPQAGALEWRLLSPLLRAVMAAGRTVVLVGPPQPPHLPGLHHSGLAPQWLERSLVWVQADTAAERLWATEQLLRANATGVLLVWLPQARPEQVRRLQVGAHGSEGLVFLCRPAAAAHESSAAPLRVQARLGPDWALQLQILKRRGPCHEAPILLPAVPGGLADVLTPRLSQPSLLLSQRKHADAVGRPVASPASLSVRRPVRSAH